MYLLSQRRRRAKEQAGCADYFLEVPLVAWTWCKYIRIASNSQS